LSPSLPPSASNLTRFAPDKVARHLLTWVTSIAVLAGIAYGITAFYPVAALLASVLIGTYLLLGPVNLLEQGMAWGIRRLSQRSGPLKQTGTILRHFSGHKYLRFIAVLIVYLAFFVMILLLGSRLPLLGQQLGDLSTRLTEQAVTVSDDIMDAVDHTAGPGTIRKLFNPVLMKAKKDGILAPFPQAGDSKPLTEDEKRVIQHAFVQTSVVRLENALAAIVPVTLNNFSDVMGGTFRAILYGITGILLTFYFLSDGRRVRHEFVRLFTIEGQNQLNYLMDSFHQIMFAFIKGQVMLGLLTGAYMFVVYSVLHVPYAFLLGCIFALAELLPVVGTWIGISIGLTVVLFSMEPITAFWVWLCSYSYQTIKDNILAPKVVGDVMGLHPLVIILSLLICAQVAGILGVLIALPFASALNVIARWLLHKEGPGAEHLPPSPLPPGALYD
jgi:predicted PurR-regulated permease PerM